MKKIMILVAVIAMANIANAQNDSSKVVTMTLIESDSISGIIFQTWKGEYQLDPSNMTFGAEKEQKFYIKTKTVLQKNSVQTSTGEWIEMTNGKTIDKIEYIPKKGLLINHENSTPTLFPWSKNFFLYK